MTIEWLWSNEKYWDKNKKYKKSLIKKTKKMFCLWKWFCIFKFQVKIGYRNYNIGWLIFTSSSSAQVNILIIVLIVILISVVIVITTLFYYMWKKKLLFFKERRCLPTARYTTNDQVHFGENGRLITAGNGKKQKYFINSNVPFSSKTNYVSIFY